MTDLEEVARLLVAHSAISDALKDLDGEVRKQAVTLMRRGDAKVVEDAEEQLLGRVRRDKAPRSYQITNPGDFEASIRFHHPEWLVSVVAPWVYEEVRKNGHVALGKTGEVFEPAGVELVTSTANGLVVTPTPLAKQRARELVGRTVAGELE